MPAALSFALTATAADTRSIVLQARQALVEAEAWDEAEPEAREALRLFPEYGGANGPWVLLATIHR